MNNPKKWESVSPLYPWSQHQPINIGISWNPRDQPITHTEEQASIREQAADYTLDGKQVPDELVRRYNQAGEIMLGIHASLGLLLMIIHHI